MIKTFYRAPFDRFSYNLWQDFLQHITVDFESYYEHVTAAQGVIPYLCKQDRFTKPLVVLAIKDCWLRRGSKVNNDADKYLQECVRKNHNKTFVLLHSLENLEVVLHEPNLHLICWGGDITNQIDQYKNMPSALNKNLNQVNNFIALNRNLRPHRIVCLSLLYALDLQHNGYTSFLGHSGLMPPELDQVWSNAPEIFAAGYKIIRPMTSLITESPEIYPYANCDNLRNFEIKLRSRYQQALIEIVSETCFEQPYFNITEKTLHTFIAGMIPIWISSVGTVQFLRTVGFDVFDDFVDHSYDLEKDRYKRIYKAIVDNIEILKNLDRVKLFWQDNQRRIKRNRSQARNIDLWYHDRVQQRFKEILPLINGV